MRASRPAAGQLAWRLEGPVDSSYSLALVNRESGARAKGARTQRRAPFNRRKFGRLLSGQTLSSTPSGYFLDARGEVAARFRELQADVVSRNLFPPRVADMQGRLNVLHNYAWEESGFPEQWVGDFNDYLQGVTCLSRHVRKVLLDNGCGYSTHGFRLRGRPLGAGWKQTSQP